MQKLKNFFRSRHRPSTALIFSMLLLGTANAYEISDELSADALVVGVFQYGLFRNNIDNHGKRIPNRGNGTLGLDLEFDYNPTDFDNIYTLWQFYLGNSLNNTWMGPLEPFGHFLENDLIRKRRQFLLEAWYRHTFTAGDLGTFGMTAGLIDSTNYVDDNAYANDEITQFMNDVFVNDPINSLPSYDWGTSLELDSGPLSLTLVAMWSRTHDDDNRNYQYYTLQLQYIVENQLGAGNYRIMGFTTNIRFPNPAGTSLEPLQGFGVSLDQQLSGNVGIFFRSYYQNNRAKIDYQWDISGGLSISGSLWNRDKDELGIAYAYLASGNSGIKNIHVFEAYARFEVCSSANISIDIQYIEDNLENAPTRTAWIPGLRFATFF